MTRYNSLRAVLPMVGALAATLSATAAEVYRWTDEDGRVVFSENVPPGVEAEKISTRTGPRKLVESKPAASPAGQNPIPEENTGVEGVKKAPEDPALRAANCRQARAVMTQLETRPRLKVLDSTGEPYFITDEERAERTAEARKSIEAWCD